MKLKFFIFLLLFSQMVFAKDLISKADLNQIDNAVKEITVSQFRGDLALFFNRLKSKNVSNCFECSSYLLDKTKNLSKEKQLVAAEFAVRMSPDFPDASLEKLKRILRYNPFDFSSIVYTSMDFLRNISKIPGEKAVFISFFNFLFVYSLTGIFFLLLVFYIKYFSLVVHLFNHIHEFSKFYFVAGLVSFSLFSFFIIKLHFSPLFILIPIVFLVFKFLTGFEKSVVFLFLLMSIVFSFVVNFQKGYQKHLSNADLVAFDTVYNPVFAKAPSFNKEEYLFSKAVYFFYRKNYVLTREFMKRALEFPLPKEFESSAKNILGICAFFTNDFKSAENYFKEAFYLTKSPKIAYNYSKTLYETKKSEGDAENLEKFLSNSHAQSFSFPMVFLPDTKVFFNFILKNKPNNESFLRVVYLKLAFLVFWFFLYLFLYVFLFVKIKITQCPECGALNCSVCNTLSSDKIVCSVCQAIKNTPDLFEKEDLLKHRKQKSLFFSKKNIKLLISSLFFTGSGLIIQEEHSFEGIFYMLFSLFFVSGLYFSFFYPYSLFNLVAVVPLFPFVFAIVFIHLIAFIRTYFTVRI